MDWQPIETAPKDGTKILGYSHGGKFNFQGCVETVGRHWGVLSYNPNVNEWDLNNYGSKHLPTYWQPLPEPPQEGR